MISERYGSIITGGEIVRLGVAVALIDQSRRLLLELRSDVHMWGITGGRLDPGETPAECGCREIKEETGICLHPHDLYFFDVYADPLDGRVLQYPENRVHLIDLVYVAYIDSSVPLVLSEESVSLEFYSASSIPDVIVPPAKQPVLDLIARGFVA